MSDRISITVDGRPVEVRAEGMLLTALREVGVDVPTLCHHPSLEPSGACRLCVVEITHAEWGGWSGLVTACLYPVERGLEVFTRSTRVRETRRGLLELYLAECPDSEEVRALARAEGVDTTPFPPKADADLCVRCGLCIRVCQDLGPAAIAALGRGTAKRVGPRPDLVGEDCTGCRACAHVCPTGEIRAEQHDGTLHIWNREFRIPVCSVEATLCRGCGICEEACPFSIPRVAPRRDGAFIAEISADTCVGCGICAGACPTGAIAQERYTDAVLGGAGLGRATGMETDATSPAAADLRGRRMVFGCSRSPVTARTGDEIEVPCVGRVTVDTMLTCLARGADGVLLMCRDQASCPYGAGGRLGERHVAVARELAAAAGLGAERVRFAQPDPGSDGPDATVRTFRSTVDPTPLAAIWEPANGATRPGLDRALAVVGWLRERPELHPVLPESLEQLFGRPVGDEETLLYLGDLPELDRLLTLCVDGWRLGEVIEDAARWLEQLGMRVRPVSTAREVETSDATRLVVFDPATVPELEREIEIYTMEELAGQVEAMLIEVHRDASGGIEPAFGFRLTQDERRDWLARLAGSPPPACVTIHELAQWKLLTRQGAWLTGNHPPLTTAYSEALRTGSDTAEETRS